MNAHFLNGMALALALIGSSLLSQLGASASLEESRQTVDPEGAATSASPSTHVEDADQTLVRAASYQRIVSLNPVADHLLLQLVEPERIVAISSVTKEGHPKSWRFGTTAAVNSADSLERVLDLRPDLVVASPFVDVAKIARLRAEEIQVFNLGEMRGLKTTLPSVDALGKLLRVPTRAMELTKSIERDLRRLRGSAAQLVEQHRRVTGLYLSVFGDSFFGGTRGTSYGDVLSLAGIDDAAEDAGYVDWPQYTAEQVLLLDPEIVVTRRGSADSIRAHPVLSRLSAARLPGRILEIHPAYDGDAGLGVLEAASELQVSLERFLRDPNHHQESIQSD